MSRMNYVFTSESVSEGHPDKVCDRISDAVLDAFLSEEPNARVACETFATTNRVVVGGEVGLADKANLEAMMGNVEQIVRDSRVAMIYEGTNEIQAIDLLLRKTLPDGGAALLQLLADIGAELGDDAQAERVKAQLARFTTFLRERLLPRAAAKDAPADLAHWLADDFLRAVAMLLMAWAWARIGATTGADAPRWQTAQSGFWRWVWPEFGMRMTMMETTLAG